MNRVTKIDWRTESGPRLGGFAYWYDALGRIVSRRHSLGGASFDRAYSYDDMDRLATDGDAAYSYDAAGNRMTRTEDGETVTYSLGQGDRLASWTGGSYQYDAAGCVTRITRGADTWDLIWNGQYQLVSVSTNGAFAESYSYDALGRRVTTTNLAGTERHVYDDSWQVVADLDEDGNVLRSYVWGEGIDRILAVKIGSRTYTALTDVQGTVWGYADEQGDIVARWTYDAWGNALTEEVDASAAELSAVRYRFQGRERSAATGLANFRMRWYDAVTGRWLSKDPIGLSGGLNLFAFCGGDGHNNTDLIGCAHIATRPLDSGGGFMQPVNNALSHLPGNIDPRHAEIFFDDNDPDGPSHCGYGPSGPHQDNSTVPYNNHGPNIYDDDIMRQAVNNVSNNPDWQGDKYGFFSRNCQDFVSAVIEEYIRLKK